ncbi:MAG TPA: MarR family transcriptional regulator [Thermoleophilaceae bacterium]|jgi:MarR family transcriptional regulator for hemolysin|nr:MarR family transcriptional regulator [Thermoleophilaceae bacterium]
MARPQATPIGLQLARTARTVSQEFERAMAAAGGSAAAWQVLLLVRSGQWGTQSGLAKAMGVTGPTMTHHLGSLEAQGFVRRWRDESNRRVQQVELTDAGIELFDRLRDVAVRHDQRLRSLLTEREVDQLSKLLHKLEQAPD